MPPAIPVWRNIRQEFSPRPSLHISNDEVHSSQDEKYVKPKNTSENPAKSARTNEET